MPTTRSLYLSIYFIFFSLLNSTVIDNLDSICPTYQALSRKYQELLNKKKVYNTQTSEVLQHKSTLIKEYYSVSAEKQFYSDFSASITQAPKMIGFGSYGAVFQMNNLVGSSENKDHSLAVKLIRVSQNIKVPHVKKEQNKIFHEINVMTKLFSLANGRYYFPHLQSCVRVTDLLRPLISGITSAQRKFYPALDFLKSKSKDQEFIALKMEKLDINYGLFIGQMFDETQEGLAFIDRLKIAKNLLKGLRLINESYLHCDIKPDNLMIKHVRPNDVDQKSPLIELTSGEKFLIKFIDFGLSVPKKLRCTGATFGYAAPELFDKRFDHKKFDIFSLGVLLVDTELQSLGLKNGLASVFMETHQYKFSKKSRLDDTIKQKLLSFRIVSTLNNYFQTKEGSDLLTKKLSQLDHLTETKIKGSIKKIFDISNPDFPHFLDHSVEYFEFVLCVMTKIYLGAFYFDLNPRVQKIKDSIQKMREDHKKAKKMLTSKGVYSFFYRFWTLYKKHLYERRFRVNTTMRKIIRTTERLLLIINQSRFEQDEKKEICKLFINQIVWNNFAYLEKLKTRLWSRYLDIITNMIQWVPCTRSNLGQSVVRISSLLEIYKLRVIKLVYFQAMLMAHFKVSMEVQTFDSVFFRDLNKDVFVSGDLASQGTRGNGLSTHSFTLDMKNRGNHVLLFI